MPKKLIFLFTTLAICTTSTAAEDWCRTQRNKWMVDKEDETALAAWNECIKSSAETQAWQAKQRAEQSLRPAPKLGMSTKDVLNKSSWGQPESVNVTQTDGLRVEQWVYGDGKYLYFRNGKLTSFQMTQ